jgi:putative hydrolase of the HAD superfamily
MIPPGTRAVFFDAVGTVLFPAVSAPAVYAEVARRNGLALSADAVKARFVEAYRVQEAVDRAAGWVTSEGRERERWRHIVSASLRGVGDPDACFAALYEHFATPAAWKLSPGVGRAVAELAARGLVVGMGSNYDSRLLAVLGGFPELAPLRDRVVVSAAVGWRKPAAEFFREVVRAAGCEPGEVLFVGDDVENDFEGAAAAGLSAVHVDWAGAHPASDRRVRRFEDLV